jgi:hypothetical protein
MMLPLYLEKRGGWSEGLLWRGEFLNEDSGNIQYPTLNAQFSSEISSTFQQLNNSTIEQINLLILSFY